MISRQDMIDRFGEQELAERSNRSDGSSIDDAVLQRAIDDAVAEAQSWTRVTLVRLVRPSAALKGFVCDIARYRLFDDAVTEIIAERYKQAVAWLREAAKHPQMLDDALLEQEGGQRNGAGAVVPNRPPQWKDWEM